MTARRWISFSPVLAAILLLGGILRMVGLSFGLPNPEIRPDEIVIVGIALNMTYVGLNPHFFHWPSLEFYVTAVVFRLWFVFGRWQGWYHIKYDMFRAAARDATGWLLVPRVLALAAGVATIWVTYRLVRDLFDRTTALIAAFFIAVAFLHVRDSHFGVTDVPATFFVVAAMLPLSRLFANPASRRDWISAGILSGLAAATKYNGGLIAAVGVAVALLWIGRARDGVPRDQVVKGLAWMALAAIAAFLIGMPYAVLDAPNFIEGLRFDSEHLVGGHGVELGRGWMYHMTFSLWYGMGAPLLIAGICGAFVLAVRAWKKAVFLCTFPALYYLLVGRGHTVFARYIDPVVPFLCMTAAFFVMEAVARLGLSSRRVVNAVIIVVSIAIALPSIQRDVAFDRLIRRPDTRLLALAWLDAHRKPSDWVLEWSPALLHPTFVIAPPMLVRYDVDQDASFTVHNERVEPEWIALPRGPLGVYVAQPPALLKRVGTDYRLAHKFIAAGDESPLIFDQQDNFFVPLGDFSARERSGPDIYIYRRID